MKKVFAFFQQLFGSGTGKIILDVAASTATTKGGELLEQGLNDFFIKHPLACKQLVSSLYIFVDTSLEDLAVRSGNTYDDTAVDRIKQELEQFAAAKQFELSNIDAD